MDAHDTIVDPPDRGRKARLLRIWLALSVLAAGGLVLAFTFLVPSKAERQEREWQRMEREHKLLREELAEDRAKELAEEKEAASLEESVAAEDPRPVEKHVSKGRGGRPAATRGARRAAPPVVVERAGIPSIPEPLMDRIRGVPVTMYMTSTCPVCTRARVWLKERGFDLTERNVDDADALAEYRRVAPTARGAVPVFVLRGKVLIGFREDNLLAAAR
jgi:glutaredoxin 3